MTELGMKQRQAETTPTAKAATAQDGPAGGTGEQAVTTAMERIAAFIPSEAIAIYVSGLGILSPKEAFGKWVLFGFCAALVPVLIWLAIRVGESKGLPAPGLRITGWHATFGLLAFAAWSAALPSTPFGEGATAYGGFAVIVLAVVLPQIAQILGVAPRS
jgi:hypothetical protein